MYRDSSKKLVQFRATDEAAFHNHRIDPLGISDVGEGIRGELERGS